MAYGTNLRSIAISALGFLFVKSVALVFLPSLAFISFSSV